MLWTHHPVNDSEVTDPDRQPVTALAVVMARHHRSVEPQARHASVGAPTLSTAPPRAPVRPLRARPTGSRGGVTPDGP